MNMRLIIKGAMLETQILQQLRDLQQIDDEDLQEGLKTIIDKSIKLMNKEGLLS